MAVVIIPAPAIVATIGNFPANQPVTVTNTPLPVSGSVSITGGVSISNFPPTPAPVAVDAQAFDDDGNPYVNPNVPGADIATGDRQMQIIAQLAAILAAPGVASNLVSLANPIQVAAVASSALAPNAAVEVAGNLQSVADTMTLVLAELRVVSALIAQLGQPVQDGPEQLRSDPVLLN